MHNLDLILVLSAGLIVALASGAAGAIPVPRRINPRFQIVSRADYLSQTGSPRGAGANEIFSGEGEVALTMTDSILRRLGAIPEQSDEERARIRSELLLEAS